MSSSEALPPARERNRQGIRSYGENGAGDATDALIDRAQITVSGSLAAKSPDALRRFADAIGTSATARILGRVRRDGNRWVAKSNKSTTISRAVLTGTDYVGHARFELEVTVNPIRTLGHILDIHPFDDIARLSPEEFFAKRPSARATSLTLDGRDNMVADFTEFAGTFHKMYVQRVATYLSLFEQALINRLLDELCPTDRGYNRSNDGGAWLAESEDLSVRLEWGQLTVSQCEVCWERRDPGALARVHALADDTLRSARSVEVPIFTHPSQEHPIGVSRELGSLAIRIPLPSEVMIVVYAKAADRLRFEIRYMKDLPDMVRPQLPRGARTLVDWFDAIRNHAAARLPWAELHQRLQPPQEPTVEALAELTVAIADVAKGKQKPKREPLIRELLLHGAITATSNDGAAPFGILSRLADRGFLEHVRLASRDAEIGRRFRLTTRYASLPILFRSPLDEGQP